MLAESNVFVRRFLRFLMIPYCFFKLVNWNECKRTRLEVLNDFIHIFFNLKTFPDHYGLCRLWEVDRKLWPLFYGSTYHPHQRVHLRKMVQPFEYQILFNDKVVCEQLCKGMGINQVESIGVLNKDNDYRNELINLFVVSGVDKLIVKPILGHGGSGIVLAQKKLDEVTVNMKQGLVPLKDFILKENAIVQKLLQQNSIISKISSSSLNTIRVVTILKKSGSVQIVSATMRFGVGVSFVDNYSSGGIAAGINCKTGKLKKYAHSKIGERFTHHPTSGFEFEGFQISSWNSVIELAQEVQKRCPFYKLLGMDIAIDNERKPILIEVNANPDIIFQEQTSGPLFADRDVLQAFAEYDLLVCKSQKKLLTENNIQREKELVFG